MLTTTDIQNIVNSGLEAGGNARKTRRAAAPKLTAGELHTMRAVMNETDDQYARRCADQALAAVAAGQTFPTFVEALCAEHGISLADEALAAMTADQVFEAAHTSAMAAVVVENVENGLQMATITPAVRTICRNEMPTPVRVFDATFTVISGKDGSHRTFRTRTNRSDASFAPGKQVVSMLTGSDNENSYTQVGFVLEGGRLATWTRQRGTKTEACCQVLLDLLTGNARGQRLLAQGYRVEESRRCCRCGRKLTTPQSIAAGIGPECAEMGV